MTAPLRAPVLALACALTLGVALAGCASGGQPTASSAANSPDTAKAYSDCLSAEGIEGLFTDDDGYVGITIDAEADGASGDSGDSSFDMDAESGSRYAEAEKKCLLSVPAYHEHAAADDPALSARLLSQSRAFASCARQNGLSDFPDPDSSAGGKLVVPEGTTKAQFLGVMTACASAFAGSSSMLDANGNDSGGGSSDAVTIAMPEFGGAYEPSWSSEVTDILFRAMGLGATPGP